MGNFAHGSNLRFYWEVLRAVFLRSGYMTYSTRQRNSTLECKHLLIARNFFPASSKWLELSEVSIWSWSGPSLRVNAQNDDHLPQMRLNVRPLERRLRQPLQTRCGTAPGGSSVNCYGQKHQRLLHSLTLLGWNIPFLMKQSVVTVFRNSNFCFQLRSIFRSCASQKSTIQLFTTNRL